MTVLADEQRMRADEQRFDPGALVELFEIDARAVGGHRHRFVPGPWNGAPVTFGEAVYTPTPVNLSGLGHAAGGPELRPTLRLSALNATIANAALGTESWAGATLTRLRTFTKYLDGAAEADPARHWPAEVWVVARLASATKHEVLWQLASPLELEGRMLPGRQVIRDVCAWRYREWDGTTWHDTRAECPYSRDEYFDAGDNPVTEPEQDVCSRRLSGCKARFPDQALPFGGFPGVGRVRR